MASAFLDWIQTRSLRSGIISVQKFGNAPDFDPGDGRVTVWDGARDGSVVENMVYDYSTTADIDSISSSNAGDTVAIEVQGLDGDYNLVTQTVTLQGQTRVPLTTPLLRVFRMKNVGATDLAGYVAAYVNTGLTAGIPTDKSKIRAVISNTANQTLMAIYTIPAGHTGYMENFWMSTAGGVANTINEVDLFVREVGGVFQLKHRSSIAEVGTSYVLHDFRQPFIIPEKSDVEIRTTTDQISSAVSAGFDLVLVPETN